MGWQNHKRQEANQQRTKAMPIPAGGSEFALFGFHISHDL